MKHEYMGPKLTQAKDFILGVGAKMFTIAGPVIVYGVSASVVYGLIYWAIQMVTGG
jgi:stage V sporulation protein AC